jgi:hypothetical protein
MSTSYSDFAYVVEHRMAEWATHNYVHTHQHMMRNRARKAVECSEPFSKFILLVDWSEKMGLTPPQSATAGTYKKIGIMEVVALYRDGAGVVCSAHPVLLESKENDVPHTHAALRAVLAEFVTKFGTGKLRHIVIFSDGGQAHFKCAQAFLYGVHLQDFARANFGTQLHVTWNFFQSYHGKGPYDAEGGVVKYFLRREMRRMRRAFRDVQEAFAFLSGCSAILEPTKHAHQHQKEFAIHYRKFYLVLESELPTLAGYTVRAAKALSPTGSLQKKRDVFSVEFDELPHIVP